MPRGPSRHRAVAALLVVQVLFGALPVAGKVAIPAFSAGGVAAARILSGMVVFQLARRLAGLPGLPWSVQPRVFLCAMLGIAANQILFLEGLARTSAVHATLILTMIPLLTAIAARALGREILSPRRLAGMVVGLAGVGVLVSEGLGTGALVGDALVLANGVAYAIYLVLSRDLLAHHPPVSVLAWLFTWAAPVALVVAGPPNLSPSPAALGALLFIVLGPTLGTYWLNLVALRTLSASEVAAFILVQPVVTAALALPFLGEPLGARTVVAALLTGLGVWIATRVRRVGVGE